MVTMHFTKLCKFAFDRKKNEYPFKKGCSKTSVAPTPLPIDVYIRSLRNHGEIVVSNVP